MPKAGFSTKDLAEESSFGFERGKGEIVESKVKVHKYNKSKKAAPSDPEPQPFLCVQLGLIHLADDLTRMDDEVKYVELKLGGKAMEHFSVGQAKSAKDDNPEDLGQEVDTEGNCVFVRVEGSQIHPKTGYGKFITSFQAAGFKAEVLGDGFLPDLIGTKGYFHNEKQEKWDGYKGEKDPTAFLCKELYVKPYEQQGKSKTAAPVKAPANAGAAKQVQAAAATSEAAGGKSNGQSSGDLMVYAVTACKAVVADLGDKLAGMELKPFRQKVQQKLLKLEVKPATIHPKIMELLKQDDTVAQIGSEAGFMVDEDGKLLASE